MFAPDATAAPSTAFIAIRGIVIARLILLVFALLRQVLLAGMGISLAALRTAGGICALISIDMGLRAPPAPLRQRTRRTERPNTSTTLPCFARHPTDCRAGCHRGAILLMANAEGTSRNSWCPEVHSSPSCLLTFVAMLTAGQIHRFLGVHGDAGDQTDFGILLSALAVQFVFDGIAQSGLLGGR